MVEVMSPATLFAAALAARDDAARLRRVSGSRRTELRRTMRVWRRGLETSKANFEARRDLRYRSGWSELDWKLPDRELDRVLVPHDGDT